jgi:putative ABC transport system permease protein
MTRSVLEERARRALPFVTYTGLATIATAGLLLVVSGRSLVAGLAAALLLILGFSLCTPLCVRVVAARLAPLAGRLGGVGARMAVAGTGAGLSRTGIAVVALAVAVSATIGVSVMVDSFRASVRAWIEQSLQADFYVRAERGAIDEAFLAELRADDAIADLSTTRRVFLEEAGGRTQLIALQMAPGSYAGIELLDTEPAAVWPAWEASNAVVVSEPYAYYHGVVQGDSIELPTDRGQHAFAVLASYRTYDANSSSVLISRHTYDRWFDDPAIDSVGVYLRPGATDENLVAALDDMATGERSYLAASNRGIRDASLAVFDHTFVITGVLYWLTLGVAFIGILSAMLALELERARETATLRALGMTPAQVGGMLTAQTGLLGLLAGIAAVPMGIVMAWVLITVINRRAFGWQIDIGVSPGTIAASVAFAVAAALLAGLYPAWRAARMSPALAMREE